MVAYWPKMPEMSVRFPNQAKYFPRHQHNAYLDWLTQYQDDVTEWERGSWCQWPRQVLTDMSLYDSVHSQELHSATPLGVHTSGMTFDVVKTFKKPNKQATKHAINTYHTYIMKSHQPKATHEMITERLNQFQLWPHPAFDTEDLYGRKTAQKIMCLFVCLVTPTPQYNM